MTHRKSISKHRRVKHAQMHRHRKAAFPRIGTFDRPHINRATHDIPYVMILKMDELFHLSIPRIKCIYASI